MERAPRDAAPRPRYTPRTAPADPFFDKPYEESQRDTAPDWEAAAKPAARGVSPNIKTRKKVPALFKVAG